jgi:hypothetical protein
MGARISELVARLRELERERAEIVAEINALRSVQRMRGLRLSRWLFATSTPRQGVVKKGLMPEPSRTLGVSTPP